jgi:hypothetical protein
MATQEEREALLATFRQVTEETRDALLAILRNEANPVDARVEAAKEILNRCWGAKPEGPVVQAVTSDGDG